MFVFSSPPLSFLAYNPLLFRFVVRRVVLLSMHFDVEDVTAGSVLLVTASFKHALLYK
jgi:hypothetical protein